MRSATTRCLKGYSGCSACSRRAGAAGVARRSRRGVRGAALRRVAARACGIHPPHPLPECARLCHVCPREWAQVVHEGTVKESGRPPLADLDNIADIADIADIAEGTVYALLIRSEQRGPVDVVKIASERGRRGGCTRLTRKPPASWGILEILGLSRSTIDATPTMRSMDAGDDNRGDPKPAPAVIGRARTRRTRAPDGGSRRTRCAPAPARSARARRPARPLHRTG